MMDRPRIRRYPGGVGDCTPGQTFDGEVTANDDDCKMQAAGSVRACTQTNPDAPGNYGPGALDATFRFLSVTIPGGARIDAAYLDIYTVAVATDDALDLLTNFYGEDADNAAQTTDWADYDGRDRTTALTAWDGQDFSTGYTNSPSIVDVVQEIVDRGGWSSGNAMQFFWQDDGTPQNSYHRHRHFDNGTDPPKLHVEYCA